MKPMASSSKLRYFPISSLTIVMGLCGLSLVILELKAVPNTTQLLLHLSDSITWLALSLLGLFFLLYALKIIKYPIQATNEFHNPLLSGYFANFPASLILFASCFFAIDNQLSKYFWIVGSSLQLLLTIIIINNWIYNHSTEFSKVTPVWLYPVMGNILVPITGVVFAPLGFSWMFFSIGVFFWLIIFMFIMIRVLFVSPLMKSMYPSMFILLGPPSVGFIAITTLQPEIDILANILYYNSVFIFLLLFLELPELLKLPFNVSSWSITFPLAAFSIASFRMYELENVEFIGIFSLILAIMLILIVIWLTLCTFVSLKNNGLAMDCFNCDKNQD